MNNYYTYLRVKEQAEEIEKLLIKLRKARKEKKRWKKKALEYKRQLENQSRK